MIKLKSLIKETVDFLNKPSDRPNENKVQLTFARKFDARTAWYRLETDGWFRRISNPGEGYGILLRSFRISGKPRIHNVGGREYWEYPVVFIYIPTEYSGDVDWDKKENEEKSKGSMGIWKHRTKADGNDVEKFVIQQIKKGTYQP